MASAGVASGSTIRHSTFSRLAPSTRADSSYSSGRVRKNELASLFIHSSEAGRERELHVNIRNGGLIANLPDDCCVEVPCLVGSGGAKPVAVGALPPQLAALN